MSLLLCRYEPVKHPYYIEILGIHIHSSQELCYVIYNHPLLVMEDFVDESLLVFIREELDMAYLADKLKVLMDGKSKSDDLLFLILSECDYYTDQEQSRFRQTVTGLRKLHPAQYAKARADDLFHKKQYGKAAQRYERLLEYPKDKVVDDGFLAGIYHNLGASYAQMFQFDRAFKALDKSYNMNKDMGTLKQIYYLTVFEPALPIGCLLYTSRNYGSGPIATSRFGTDPRSSTQYRIFVKKKDIDLAAAAIEGKLDRL